MLPLDPPPEHSLAGAAPDPWQDRSESAVTDRPGAWRKPRVGDRTWVSHRPSTGGPPRSFWLTYRAGKDTPAQE